MEELLQAISMVGFPIVAYGGMFWYIVKLNENHKDEISSMQQSLNQNTQALIELKNCITRLERQSNEN